MEKNVESYKTSEMPNSCHFSRLQWWTAGIAVLCGIVAIPSIIHKPDGERQRRLNQKHEIFVIMLPEVFNVVHPLYITFT